MGSGGLSPFGTLQNPLQNTLHSVTCSNDVSSADTAVATPFPADHPRALPHLTGLLETPPLAWPRLPASALWGRLRALDLWRPVAATGQPGAFLAHIWGPTFLDEASRPSCCGVRAASYLWGEVLGHNFLPFFSQFFIWSNFIFCLKQKKEKNNHRFTHEHRIVPEPGRLLDKTPRRPPDRPLPPEEDSTIRGRARRIAALRPGCTLASSQRSRPWRVGPAPPTESDLLVMRARHPGSRG